MKTNIFDYILSSCVGILIVFAAYFSMSYLIAPLTIKFLPNLDVFLNGLFFLFCYGMYSAFIVRVCLKLYPLKEGTISMSNSHFMYWKFITVIHEFGRGSLLPFTTVFAKPLVGFLFGAKMGKNIGMGGNLVDPWLITISDNAILGLNSAIIAHAITSGQIILKPVVIKKGATVGVHCVIMPGVVVGENSVVVAGSVVKMDTIIPNNELWGGMPAKKIKNIEIKESLELLEPSNIPKNIWTNSFSEVTNEIKSKI